MANLIQAGWCGRLKPPQSERVCLSPRPAQPFFDRIGNAGVFQEALRRRLRFAADFFVTPIGEFLFGDNFDRGVPEAGRRAGAAVDLGEGGRVNFVDDSASVPKRRQPIVLRTRSPFSCSTKHRQLRCHVVFPAGPAPGKIDLVFGAPADELLVNELAAVAAVDAAQGEGDAVSHVLDGLHDPAAGAAGL